MLKTHTTNQSKKVQFYKNGELIKTLTADTVVIVQRKSILLTGIHGTDGKKYRGVYYGDLSAVVDIPGRMCDVFIYGDNPVWIVVTW